MGGSWTSPASPPQALLAEEQWETSGQFPRRACRSRNISCLEGLQMRALRDREFSLTQTPVIRHEFDWPLLPNKMQHTLFFRPSKQGLRVNTEFRWLVRSYYLLKFIGNHKPPKESSLPQCKTWAIDTLQVLPNGKQSKVGLCEF